MTNVQIKQYRKFGAVDNAYQQLFGDAVKEYNEKQKRADRRIENYYQHIADGKREEAFYEAIVQFGDSKTAPCGSKTGEAAQQMLGMLEKTAGNAEFFQRLKGWMAVFEKEGYSLGGKG